MTVNKQVDHPFWESTLWTDWQVWQEWPEGTQYKRNSTHAKLYHERDEQLSIASQEEQPVLQGTEVEDRPADQEGTRQGEEDCSKLGMEDTILVKSPRPVAKDKYQRN